MSFTKNLTLHLAAGNPCPHPECRCELGSFCPDPEANNTYVCRCYPISIKWMEDRSSVPCNGVDPEEKSGYSGTDQPRAPWMWYLAQQDVCKAVRVYPVWMITVPPCTTQGVICLLPVANSSRHYQCLLKPAKMPFSCYRNKLVYPFLCELLVLCASKCLSHATEMSLFTHSYVNF